MKTPVIVSKDYTVYTEQVDTYVFIHMDVHRWSKDIKNCFMKDWNTWANQQVTDLLAMPFIDNIKMEKWVKMCGFNLLENHLCTDGVTRKLYIWSK